MDTKRLTKLIFLAIIMALVVVFVRGYVKLAFLKAKNEQLAEEIKEIKKANQELERELELLGGDKEYIEKVAREKLGLTKEGEIIYKIEGE